MTRGHACELTILFVREAVDPCPHCLCSSFEDEAEEPCRLATSSARFARSAPPLSERDHRVLVDRQWGEEGAVLVTERGSMGRDPRVKDTRAGIGDPMRGGANVPLLLRSLEHPLSSRSTVHEVGCHMNETRT